MGYIAAMGGSKRKHKRNSTQASEADKYALYQAAVQEPEHEIEFFDQAFGEAFGRKPRVLREDFCGTALLSSVWIARHPENTAEGVDNDPEPIDWGRAHNFAPLGEDASRMHFHIADVREKSLRRPDLRLAFNFSYCGLKTRPELLEYFRSARKDLPDDGLFVLDVHGGPEIYEEMEEERPCEGGFTYVWEQGDFYPATGEAKRAISFEFKDKTSLKRIFEYEWRLWTLPELKDALEEAGFSQVDSYWEGEGEDGDGRDLDLVRRAAGRRRRRLSRQPAAGARARLLHGARLRVDHRSPGRPGDGVRRRAV